MKTDHAYLSHIMDSIAKIESYATVGKEEFMSLSHWQDAIIRNLEIIGEATKRLSKPLKEQYPDIPWRSIATKWGQIFILDTHWLYYPISL